MLYLIAIFVICIALAAFCKAAMDTRTFQKPTAAFKKYPQWFRDWMQRRGTVPVIKIDDGWHTMQALCFLFTSIAFICVGILFPIFGYWILLSIPLRSSIHGAVFELTYPML